MEQAQSSSSAFAVFRNRSFFFLWLAMLVSEFGSGITAIAASILVYRETGSSLSVGLMLMATALPGLLFGLVAGVFVDRVDRKRIIVAAELLSGMMIFLIPVLLPYGIHWLYILVALKSTVYQFFSPAYSSILPDITTDAELGAANSLITASQTAAMGMGFAAAGFITSQLTPEWAFFIDATTFFIAAAVITLISIPKLKVKEDSSVASVVNNLKSGFKFVWHSPILRSAMFITLPMGIVFGFINSAMLPFASRALGATEFEYSLIEGVGLVGFVLGGITMSVLSDRLREGQWLSLSYIAMGVLSVVFSQLTSVSAVILVNVVILFFNVPSFVGRSLIIQRNTTREVRGRVSSVYFVMRDFSFVLGMALVGITDSIDVRDGMLIMSLILVVTGIVTLFMPGLRRPAQEWLHSLELLRGISEAEGLDVGRSITMTDFNRLVEIFPTMENLTLEDRQHIMSDMTWTHARQGTVIVRQGEVNDSAYFILEGSAVVGHIEGATERVLAILSAGDFFGEIAALTGQPRTANIVAKDEAVLLRVPANTLKEMAKHPVLNRLFFSKMMERMLNLEMLDVPRRTGVNAGTARSMRTTSSVAVVAG